MRKMARRFGAVSALTLAAGSAFVGWAGEANAVSNIQTGYWSSLPASPQTPAGGFEVASNPSGASAVSALRFSLAPGEVPTTLNLKVAQAQPASQVAIEACVIAAKSASWTPPSGGGPGAISSAPTPDCASGIVGGALSSDGTTETFDLTPLSFQGQVNLLLEPSAVASPVGGAVPGAPSTVNPLFDADFQPLTSAEIAVTFAPSAPTPPSAGNASVGQPAPAPAPAPAPSGADISLPPATTTGSGVAPVVAPSQPATTNAASSGPLLVRNNTNWRLLFAVAMFSADLLFGLMWLQRHRPAGEREPLSIYDPPPASAPTATTRISPAN